MDPGVKEFVRRRAGHACEYCRIPQDATPLISFHIEHIVSRQHGGSDEPSSLGRATVRLLNMNAARRCARHGWEYGEIGENRAWRIRTCDFAVDCPQLPSRGLRPNEIRRRPNSRRISSCAITLPDRTSWRP